MNRADLVTRIAKDADITKRQAEKALNALVGSVQEQIQAGEKLTGSDQVRCSRAFRRFVAKTPWAVTAWRKEDLRRT